MYNFVLGPKSTCYQVVLIEVFVNKLLYWFINRSAFLTHSWKDLLKIWWHQLQKFGYIDIKYNVYKLFDKEKVVTDANALNLFDLCIFKSTLHKVWYLQNVQIWNIPIIGTSIKHPMTPMVKGCVDIMFDMLYKHITKSNSHPWKEPLTF